MDWTKKKMVLMGAKGYWRLPLVSAYQAMIIEIRLANQITVFIVMGQTCDRSNKLWFLVCTCKCIEDITKPKKKHNIYVLKAPCLRMNKTNF